MIEVETAQIIVELVNQDKQELSNMVLDYLDLILRKDEICLKVYREKICLSSKIAPEAKEDFIRYFEICYKLRLNHQRIQQGIQLKQLEDVKIGFDKICLLLDTIAEEVFEPLSSQQL